MNFLKEVLDFILKGADMKWQLILTVLIVFFGSHSSFAESSKAYEATPNDKALILEAIKAKDHSYSPYSQYRVGAALRTKQGNIYRGTNVENASYGLTICAERCAIFSAVAASEREFEALALVTRDGGFPCGACRQVLNEFNPNMIVLSSDFTGKKIVKYRLCDLLKEAFGPQNLEK
jgi:cytidine deaminase